MARDTDAIVGGRRHRPRHGGAAAEGARPRGGPRPGPDRRRWPGWWRSVGVPVLFLGGPRGGAGREVVLAEVADAMAGGAAGMAVGRVVFEDPDPATMAKLVADAGARRLILTLDLGTSTTKAVVWEHDGARCLGPGRAGHRPSGRGPGRAGPAGAGGRRWWPPAPRPGPSDPGAFAAVEAVGFSAARQTFVLRRRRRGAPRSGPRLVRWPGLGRGGADGPGARWAGGRPGPDGRRSSTGPRWRPRWPGWPGTSPTGWPRAAGS